MAVQHVLRDCALQRVQPQRQDVVGAVTAVQVPACTQLGQRVKHAAATRHGLLVSETSQATSAYHAKLRSVLRKFQLKALRVGEQLRDLQSRSGRMSTYELHGSEQHLRVDEAHANVR